MSIRVWQTRGSGRRPVKSRVHRDPGVRSPTYPVNIGSGAWYNDGNMDDSDERVATYEYDALFRRIEKTVGNQGTGVVHGSDGSGSRTGIEAGNRHEHYFYTGWCLIETTNHAESAGDYSYSDADVLNQFVYGTQYIDEPLVYDRNEDPNEDDSCLEVDDGEDADGDSSRYFYHQDANFRVVALTDESAGVVERYRYTAYGEPTVFGGENASGDELANAMFVSTVGNPFMHQGLFRDTDIASYQNRIRELHSRLGRFMQEDSVAAHNLYSYCNSDPLTSVDPFGLQEKKTTTEPSSQPSSQPGGGREVPGSATPIPKEPTIHKYYIGRGYVIILIKTADGRWVTNCYGDACESQGQFQPISELMEPGHKATKEEFTKFIQGLGCKKKTGKCPEGTVAVRFYRDDKGNWHAVRLDGPGGKASAKPNPVRPRHECIDDPDEHTKHNVNPDAKPFGDYCCPKRKPINPKLQPGKPEMDPHMPQPPQPPKKKPGAPGSP